MDALDSFDLRSSVVTGAKLNECGTSEIVGQGQTKQLLLTEYLLQGVYVSQATAPLWGG